MGKQYFSIYKCLEITMHSGKCEQEEDHLGFIQECDDSLCLVCLTLMVPGMSVGDVAGWRG